MPAVPPDPLYRFQIAQVRREVDLARLNEEAAALIGLRDFGAFCRRREGGSTIRTLLELRWSARTVRPNGRCHRVHRTSRCVLPLDGAVARRGAGRRRNRSA